MIIHFLWYTAMHNIENLCLHIRVEEVEKQVPKHYHLHSMFFEIPPMLCSVLISTTWQLQLSCVENNYAALVIFTDWNFHHVNYGKTWPEPESDMTWLKPLTQLNKHFHPPNHFIKARKGCVSVCSSSSIININQIDFKLCRCIAHDPRMCMPAFFFFFAVWTYKAFDNNTNLDFYIVGPCFFLYIPEQQHRQCHSAFAIYIMAEDGSAIVTGFSPTGTYPEQALH